MNKNSFVIVTVLPKVFYCHGNELPVWWWVSSEFRWKCILVLCKCDKPVNKNSIRKRGGYDQGDTGISIPWARKLVGQLYLASLFYFSVWCLGVKCRSITFSKTESRQLECLGTYSHSIRFQRLFLRKRHSLFVELCMSNGYGIF